MACTRKNKSTTASNKYRKETKLYLLTFHFATRQQPLYTERAGPVTIFLGYAYTRLYPEDVVL